MKRYFILLPIFFLALSQGVFLSLNLVLLTVLFWAALRPPKESLALAFFSGLFLDLAKGTPLGLSSLALLIASKLLLLYKRKLDPLHFLFFPVFVFLSAGLYCWIINHQFYWQESLILAVLASLVRLAIRHFSPEIQRGDIRLKV